MKVLAVIGIGIAALSFGQTNYEGDKKGGDVERSVTQIEQELVKGLIAGDASMFERYLADTYIFTAPDGVVSDKAQTIADIKSGDLKFQSSKLDNMKVWTCPHLWHKKLRLKIHRMENGEFESWGYRAGSSRKSLRLPRCGS
jgi:hypothetical protein